MTFPPLIIWAKATFFFEQLFSGRGQNMVCPKKWAPLFWPKILVFGPKIRFLPYDPNFDHNPFLALGMTVNFPHWERFFDFPFRSYSCFRKKIRLTCQKVFPLPIVGAPSASKSPSALSAGPSGPRASRGLDNQFHLAITYQGKIITLFSARGPTCQAQLGLDLVF